MRAATSAVEMGGLNNGYLRVVIGKAVIRTGQIDYFAAASGHHGPNGLFVRHNRLLRKRRAAVGGGVSVQVPLAAGIARGIDNIWVAMVKGHAAGIVRLQRVQPPPRRANLVIIPTGAVPAVKHQIIKLYCQLFFFEYQ